MAQLKQLTAINLTAGGTPQVLSATDLMVDTLVLHAPAANSGAISIGGPGMTIANAAIILQKGDTVTLHAEKGNKLNLKEIYFDGTTNDDIRVGYSSGLKIDFKAAAL